MGSRTPGLYLKPRKNRAFVMDKLKPIQIPFVCRCGVRHAKLATARWDAVDRLHYDCAVCRPRPLHKLVKPNEN